MSSSSLNYLILTVAQRLNVSYTELKNILEAEYTTEEQEEQKKLQVIILKLFLCLNEEIQKHDRTLGNKNQYARMLFCSKSECHFLSKFENVMQSLNMFATENLSEQHVLLKQPDYSSGQIDMFAELDANSFNAQTTASNDDNVNANANSQDEANAKVDGEGDENAKLTKPAQNTPAQKKSSTKDNTKKRGPKKLSFEALEASGFPVETIVLNETENLLCPICQSQMKIIGTTVVRQEVVYTPASYKLVKYVTRISKCVNKECEELNVPAIPEGQKLLPALINHSLLSPSLAANLLCNKFAAGLPFYRLCSLELLTGNLPIDYKLVNKWSIQLFDRYLEPLVELLRQKLLEQNVIHADETRMLTINCIKDGEKGRKASQGWLWNYCSNCWEKHKVHYVAYSPSRKKENANGMLENFNGVVVSDRYAGYVDLSKMDIEQAGCYAHLRRRGIYFLQDFLSKVGNNKLFKDQMPLSVQVTIKLLELINKLFSIEDTCRMYTPEARLATRQERAAPIVDEFFSICHKYFDPKRMVQEKFKDFIGYAINNEQEFRTFLKNGMVDMTNNVAEQAIRSIAVGRKNYLFCNNNHGGTVVAGYYTIIHTAQLNNLDPEKYLMYIFSRITDPKYRNMPELLEEFWPWNQEIQKECHSTKFMAKRSNEQPLPKVA